MRRRVVVTGMGAIAPLAHGVDELYRAQIAGRSGIGPITHFNASRFPTRIAAEVKQFDLGQHLSDAKRWTHAGTNTRFALAAAQQALSASGVLDSTKTQ